jgi:hypothetical protein
VVADPSMVAVRDRGGGWWQGVSARAAATAGDRGSHVVRKEDEWTRGKGDAGGRGEGPRTNYL